MSAACAPEMPKAAPKITEVRNYQANFVCEGEQRMHVQFSPYSAELESQGLAVAMAQQPAADGYSYAGSGQSLRARGPEATWTDDKGAVHHCREATVATSKINMPAR
jgi:membrane-bound inhibitor of C-type lysozyme